MDQENINPKSGSSSLFLAPENLCGQTLLSIVGRGHSILADIRILSERVPPAFLAAAQLDDDKPQEAAPAGLFGYFSGPVKQTKSAESKEDTEDVKKYVPFLFDFSYLHNPEEWEASLSIPPSNNLELQSQQSAENIADLEREFAINHRSILEEFYELFYSIYEYQEEVNQFANDLTKGYFIQYTVESVLLDLDGRALLCEAVWLYGVMLMMMERFLPVSI
jgi:WASH complex subunit strumpellin